MRVKTDFLNPTPRKTLLLIMSGTMWLVVGIMLNNFAYMWLREFKGGYSIIYATIGFCVALVVHHYGFLRIVDKNIGRISLMKDKPNVFSFMSGKSYFIVAIMITLGHVLRHSAVPKQYLAVIYIGIGLSLFFSSFRYFIVIFNELRRKV